MGSMIHLSVGRLEIDWGKNYGFSDHSPLFQSADLAQVPYYYVDERTARCEQQRPGARERLHAKEGREDTFVAPRVLVEQHRNGPAVRQGAEDARRRATHSDLNDPCALPSVAERAIDKRIRQAVVNDADGVSAGRHRRGAKLPGAEVCRGDDDAARFRRLARRLVVLVAFYLDAREQSLAMPPLQQTDLRDVPTEIREAGLQHPSALFGAPIREGERQVELRIARPRAVGACVAGPDPRAQPHGPLGSQVPEALTKAEQGGVLGGVSRAT